MRNGITSLSSASKARSGPHSGLTDGAGVEAGPRFSIFDRAGTVCDRPAVSRRLALGVLIFMLCGALPPCATAGAAVVTVGSPLSAGETSKECTFPGGCVIFNSVLVDRGLPVVSPVSGAVVLWRLGDASAQPGYQLQVFRQVTAKEFTVTASSPTVTPVGSGGIETFPAALPIKAGEFIGVDVPHGAAIGGVEGEGAYFFATPELATGTIGAFEAVPGAEIAVNADVQPAPTITSLGTTGGSTTGGTTVTISGTDFASVQSVAFGATAATYQVDSESQITATSPAGAAGPVPVTVTTIAGSATAGQQFTYASPATPTATPTPTPTPTPRSCKAPKLTGKKLKAAEAALRKADCRPGHIAKKRGVTARSGKVSEQSPKPGKVVPAGSKVNLRLS